MAKGAYIGVNNVARKIRKGYIGIENFTKRNLPAGYTQVEYIEATGSQHFDTGFKHNNNTRVVMKAQVTTKPTAHAWLFEGRVTTDSGAKSVFLLNGGTWTSDYAGSGNRVQFSSIGVTDLLNIDYNKNTLTINGVSQTWTAETFQSTVNLVLFANNTNGAISGHIKARGWDAKVYDNGMLIRDYVACVNSAGEAGFYDIVNGTFGGDAAGVGFVAGPTYKGVARKIVKAYVGIGGVARPCWPGEGLEYYGTITPLNTARHELAATTVGDYAIFAGGLVGSTVTNVADAYDRLLTRSSLANLVTKSALLAATTVGDYALFAGGQLGNGASTNQVTFYNKFLTCGEPTVLMDLGMHSLAAATVGVYALFGGGRYGSNDYNQMNAYSDSLTKHNPDALSQKRSGLAAATVGDYAVFVGGISGNTYQVTVDAYSKTLVRSTPTNILYAVSELAAATVGDYALFAGGVSTTARAYVNAYNKSLTKTTVTQLSEARSYLAGASIEGYAIFAGGRNASSQQVSTVDVYDSSLTRTTVMQLNAKKEMLAATTIAGYALFAGGINTGTDSATVEAYTVA